MRAFTRPGFLLWSFAGLYILGPWLTLDGIRLFGIDGGGFRFFGALLTPSHPFVVLPALLSLLFFLLWIAGALGRYWCGRLCPQSLLSNIGAPLKKNAKVGEKVLRHLKIALYGALISISTVAYFLERTSNSLLATPGVTAAVAGTLLFLILYLDGVFVGRRFCRTLCPYGKLLAAFSGPGALGPHLGEENKKECIKCLGCVKACPMGLDVRGEAGPECIYCDGCVEACERVFAPKNKPGLITYRVPKGGWLMGLILKQRTLPLLGGALICLVIFVQQATQAPHASIDLRIAPDVMVRVLPDGGRAMTLATTVRALPGSYRFEVKGKGGEATIPEGLDGLTLGGDERFKARIPLFLAKGTTGITLTLLDSDSKVVLLKDLDLPPERGGSK